MINHLARRMAFRSTLIAIATSVCITVAIPLSSSIPAKAQSDKFDGEWLAQGQLSCAPKGHDSFEAVVTILNSQLSGKLKGTARDYEITGGIDSAGRLNTGHLLSVLLGYSPVLNAVGKFGVDKGNISYSSPGGAGAYCGGDMVLTRTSSKTFALETNDAAELSQIKPAAGGDDGTSIESRLRMLNDMLEKGLITPGEAKVKRVKILEEL